MTPGRTKGGRSAGHSPVKKTGSLGTGTRTAASGRAKKHGETYAAQQERRTKHAVRSVRESAEQTELAFTTDQLPGASSAVRIPNGSANRLGIVDRPIHDWYRFVLSFPAHLVRYYISNFGLQNHAVVLDPFCGTGTTLVKAHLQGMRVMGVETNPFACFTSQMKLT